MTVRGRASSDPGVLKERISLPFGVAQLYPGGGGFFAQALPGIHSAGRFSPWETA